MTTKKTYTIGDTVWIYGIDRTNIKLTPGKIIHSFTLEELSGEQYVIAVDTPIEPLLEIRTWETISQDSRGPAGGFRDLVPAEDSAAIDKKLAHAGFVLGEEMLVDPNEPTPEQIHAAMERSQQATVHAPLLIKEAKPKRRFTGRKKKQ